MKTDIATKETDDRVRNTYGVQGPTVLHIGLILIITPWSPSLVRLKDTGSFNDWSTTVEEALHHDTKRIPA